MCRSIKTLFNFDPPAIEEEIRAASLQFVRKVSGFNTPSKANAAAFEAAVDEVASAAGRLLASLETSAQPRDRETEVQKARRRRADRFGDRARGTLRGRPTIRAETIGANVLTPPKGE